MLRRRRKRKTGTQIVRDLTDNLTEKVSRISKRNLLPMRQILIACIIIFFCSICFGVIGYVKKTGEIRKKEHNIEELKSELKCMEELLVEKRELKERLINDSLTIEALARSYGLSRKGENIFYFLDSAPEKKTGGCKPGSVRLREAAISL